MKKKLTILKTGGKVLDEDRSFNQVIRAFHNMPGHKILVHGGGSLVTSMAESMGLVVRMIEGRRVTDERTLDLVVMVYGGLINKKIVAALQSHGTNALGLTGVDLDLIHAGRRSDEPVDYGLVGDIQFIRTSAFIQLMYAGYIPVLAPVTHDTNGQLLNTNADTVASLVASSLIKKYQVKLIFCIDKPGVLLDQADKRSVIEHLDTKKYEELRSRNQIADGMIPKLESCLNASHHGVPEIFITNVDNLEKESPTGTRITK